MSFIVYPLLTVSLSLQSLSKNKNLLSPYLLMKFERQRNETVATQLSDNWTTRSNGLAWWLSQEEQARRKCEVAGTIIAKRKNIDHDNPAVQMSDWSTHIHRRYDLKLFNSSWAWEAERLYIFAFLLINASLLLSPMAIQSENSRFFLFFEIFASILVEILPMDCDCLIEDDDKEFGISFTSLFFFFFWINFLMVEWNRICTEDSFSPSGLGEFFFPLFFLWFNLLKI